MATNPARSASGHSATVTKDRAAPVTATGLVRTGNARNAKAFELWNSNWVRFVERNVGAWMHIEHILGLYVFASNERSAPTNMHNTALAANSTRKIRFAQDLALYNLTLSEEIDGFDGAAHLDAWDNAPEWQGARKFTEALTAVQDDWGEAIFAANCVFEPLVGELFRSNLVMQSAATNGDYVTPTVMGAGEYDYAQRDLRWSIACFAPLTQDREFAEHNRSLMGGWLRERPRLQQLQRWAFGALLVGFGARLVF